MKNFMSFLDFIDNENNIVFELSHGLSSKCVVYAIEEYSEIIEFSKNNVIFAKMSRYPNIKQSGNNIERDLFSEFESFKDNINKVLFRFSNQLRIKSPQDYDETLRLLIKTADNIIKKYKITLVLFRDFPHTPFEIVFYYYALIHKLETQFLFPLPRINRTEERFFLTPDFSSLPIRFWDTYKLIKESDSYLEHQLPMDLLAYYKEYDKDIKTNNFYFGLRKSKFNLLSRYYRRIKINLHVNGGKKTLIKAIKKLIYISPYNTVIQGMILRFYERNAIRNLPANEIYLYFALHYQPEATTIPWGNNYSNQLIAIQEISKNLPVGYFLYVKEHPTYWNLNNTPNFTHYRSIDFYREILKLDNVRLISHVVPSHLLIPKAKCVITITGTIAFESFYLNKPCIVLGSIYYKDFPTSFSPNNYEDDLNLLLKDVLSVEKNLDFKIEFNNFLRALARISIYTRNPLVNMHDWSNPYISDDFKKNYSETNKSIARFIINELT